MLNWIYCKLLGYLQRKCKHPSHLVLVDVADCVCSSTPVAWCTICGAVRVNDSDFREPRADWWIRERAWKPRNDG